MIVCHCHAVSDRVVRACVRSSGAACVDDVGDLCEAGTGCGGCVPTLEEILEAEGAAFRAGSHAPHGHALLSVVAAASDGA